MKDKRFKTKELVHANVRHRKFQYFMVALITFVTCFAMTGGAVIALSMNIGLSSLKDRIGADIIIVPEGSTRVSESALYGGEPCTVTMPASFVNEVQVMPGVTDVASRLYFATLDGQDCCASETQLIVTDLQHDFLLHSLTDNMRLEQGNIIVGSSYFTKPGESIRYFNRDLNVYAVLPQTGTGYDSSCFITVEDADEIMNDPDYTSVFDGIDARESVSMVFLNSDDVNITLDYLEENYENKGIEWFSFNSQIDDFARSIDDAILIIVFFEVMLCLACMISLFCLFSVFVFNRKHEIGSLRLLQFSWKSIYMILLREGLFVIIPFALLGYVSYSLLMTVCSSMMSELLSVPLLPLTFYGVLLVLGGALVSAIIATVLSIGLAFLRVKSIPLVELVNGGD